MSPINQAESKEPSQESARATREPQTCPAPKAISFSELKRAMLMAIGTCSLAVGIVGIFLPILPTTPFLLLSAACYIRSSQRFYHWLTSNRFFGEYVRDYIEIRGVTLKVKLSSLALLWITISCSAAFATDTLWIRILLAAIGVGVTLHIVSLRTLKR